MTLCLFQKSMRATTVRLRPARLRIEQEILLEVYLVDGTYELFRHYYALPSARDQYGREVAAVRGVLMSMLGLIKSGATHLAVATDHVIESFRNKLWPGYKTGAGVPRDLLAQFHLLEEVLSAARIAVWPMIEFEADDALAASAAAAARDKRVQQVIVCTPDKDLAQCAGGYVMRTAGGSSFVPYASHSAQGHQ